MFAKLKQYRKRFMTVFYSRTAQSVIYNAMHLLLVLLVVLTVVSGFSLFAN